MKIHGYLAKQVMGSYQIPIPKGDVAKTGEEAREIASQIGGRN